jgi:tetratricopeptide (TPR) repeat protein
MILVKYSNTEQSLYYNDKHKQISLFNINGFVANYNCGICQRVTGKYEESIESFNAALKISEDEGDIESSIMSIYQIAICYAFLDNINSFIEYTQVAIYHLGIFRKE